MFLLSVSALKNLGFRGVHCISQVIQQDKMKVKILPALSDNYMYLVNTQDPSISLNNEGNPKRSKINNKG